jgi:hypothetical protein
MSEIWWRVARPPKTSDEIRDLILRRRGKPIPKSDGLPSKDKSRRSKQVPSG